MTSLIDINLVCCASPSQGGNLQLVSHIAVSPFATPKSLPEACFFYCLTTLPRPHPYLYHLTKQPTLSKTLSQDGD